MLYHAQSSSDLRDSSGSECSHTAQRSWPLLFSAGLRPPAAKLHMGMASRCDCAQLFQYSILEVTACVGLVRFAAALAS